MKERGHKKAKSYTGPQFFFKIFGLTQHGKDFLYKHTSIPHSPTPILLIRPTHQFWRFSVTSRFIL